MSWIPHEETTGTESNENGDKESSFEVKEGMGDAYSPCPCYNLYTIGPNLFEI